MLTCSAWSSSPTPSHERPQSSLRKSPVRPTRYTRPRTKPETSARAGAALVGVWIGRQRSLSLRKSADAPETSARSPSTSNAAAKAGPIRTLGPSISQSRPPFRERDTPLSVARSRWFGFIGLTASASAPLTKLPGLT